MRISTTEDRHKKIIYILFWILIWHLISLLVDNPIYLPSPWRVLGALLTMMGQGDFWSSIANSILKIALGFLLAIVSGLVLAYLSFKSTILRELILVPLDLLKASPVASLTIILLVWIRSKYLSLFLVALTLVSNIYYSAYEAFINSDLELLEMAEVFAVEPFKVFKEIYLESLKLYLKPAILVSTGLAMKSGVSAEVLAMAEKSIGENIYYSKLYLNTDELMAWTLVIVGLSKVFFLIIECCLRRRD